jgi:hypothetical protein
VFPVTGCASVLGYFEARSKPPNCARTQQPCQRMACPLIHAGWLNWPVVTHCSPTFIYYTPTANWRDLCSMNWSVV